MGTQPRWGVLRQQRLDSEQWRDGIHQLQQQSGRCGAPRTELDNPRSQGMEWVRFFGATDSKQVFKLNLDKIYFRHLAVLRFLDRVAREAYFL